MKRKLTAEEQPWIGKDTMPGFTIKCDFCGSKHVYLENTLGYSAESGGWGSLTLVCSKCEKRTDIYDHS